MNEETIVAVFDNAAEADAAVIDLHSAGVPRECISQHREGDAQEQATAERGGTEHRGFWARLFGTESTHDSSVYDRSMAGGSTIVTVRGPEEHIHTAMEVLERHQPVDIDEREAGYTGAGTTTNPAHVTGAAGGEGAVVRDTETGDVEAGEKEARAAEEGETIALSEEQLNVGKRAVNRGTTRVHRYVTERPATEEVALREERVKVERRRVTDGETAADGAFTDKVVEVTETAEEAVVGKTARVVEEVVVRKDVSERRETVKDTVRKEDVEITSEPAGENRSSS